MPDLAKLQKDFGIRRTRSRRKSFSFDKDEIADRVIKFFDADLAARSDFIEARLQRYAKYRMWTERNSVPWEDASDVPLPDLMTDSLRMQDTLYNAVIGFGKPVGATALRAEEDEKVENVDNLIHHQLFVDMSGDTVIGDMAENFVNDGVYTVFIPWVREDKKVSDQRILPPIPVDIVPQVYFQQIVSNEFPDAISLVPTAEGWDWRVEQRDEKPVTVEFYTQKDGKVEMIIRRVIRVFDGPRPQVKDVDEVLHPWRVENLQPPGPSNPGGSPHVILVDYPTVNEIVKLQKTGFYDLLTKKDLDALGVTSKDGDNQELKDQKDVFQGTTDDDVIVPDVPSHKTLTRLICFDMYDIDGDGVDEDVIWWMIKETKTVCKVKLLTEMYPANPPRRPFAEASMIPVKGRRIGISYLEMGEGLHDTVKEIIDQTIDSGTLASSPFFFYKSTGLQKPETMTLNPGEGYPMADPKNDILFPQIPNSSQAFGINMITLLGQMRERLTMVSDIQAGKVPAGKSSALRTSGGIQQLISQAEARPERILRRFFLGLTEVYRQIHELNQRFLPKKKQIKITGNMDEGRDPYQTITDAGMIEGRFQFTFSANIFNIDKSGLQQALTNLMGVVISPLTLQSGITDVDKIYRLLKRYIESWGQDPRDYIRPPTPTSDMQLIQAEEAIISVMNDVMPVGFPFEGYIGHLQKLQAFLQAPEYGFLTASQVALFNTYFQRVTVGAQQEAQQQQLMQAAAQFTKANAQQQQGGGQPAQAPNMTNPQLNENEMIDREMKS